MLMMFSLFFFGLFNFKQILILSKFIYKLLSYVVEKTKIIKSLFLRRNFVLSIFYLKIYILRTVDSSFLRLIIYKLIDTFHVINSLPIVIKFILDIFLR